MNQFEEAKLKAQKRIERQAKYAAPQAVVPDARTPNVPANAASVETHKEKRKDTTAAEITVWVQLPDGGFSMKFVKQHVYQNAIRSKLTKQEFSNRIKEGLWPLLGGIDEFPGSC